MSSVVAEVDTALQAMQALKAPGISGSKIAAITALCTGHVQVTARILSHPSTGSPSSRLVGSVRGEMDAKASHADGSR